MVRLCCLLLAWIAAATAAPAAADPQLMRLEVAVVESRAPAFEQEMVLLEVTGTYRRPVTLEKMQQPDFAGAAWIQLGRDEWADITLDGLAARRMTRRIALFPQKSGRALIEPFVHHLTILGTDGRRQKLDVRSAPLRIEVGRRPQGQAPWLPARSLTVIDTWSKPPDGLVFGDSVQRRVLLLAHGLMPESLPAQPVLLARGVAAFPGPEERSVELLPDGPLARVSWSWTVRLLAPDADPLPAVPFAWFDTLERKAKQAEIPAARVALAGSLTANPGAVTAPAASRFDPLLPGLAGGVLVGLLFFLPGRRLKPWPEIKAALARLLPDPELAAASAGDLNALRRAAARLAPSGLEAERAALDRALYGRDAPADGFDRHRLIGLLQARR